MTEAKITTAENLKEGDWIIFSNPRFNTRVVGVEHGSIGGDVKVLHDYGNGGNPATSFYKPNDNLYVGGDSAAVIPQPPKAKTAGHRIKFFYNGIKANGGELQKAWYSDGEITNKPDGTITIYARDYEHFSAEVREVFKVENNTDTMTDYFDSDKIRVEPDHPLYAEVKKALDKQAEHRRGVQARRKVVKAGMPQP